MTDMSPVTPVHNTRGAILSLFGAIMIILGTLNTMLSWRGGFEVVSFQVGLIATGIILCVIGAIRRQNAH